MTRIPLGTAIRSDTGKETRLWWIRFGFNDKFWFDYKGHPHTEKLHTVERYTRTDEGHMEITVTIDDPGTYTQPFTTIGRATLMPGAEILEYICLENEQDLQRLEGPVRGAGLALEP